MCKEIKTIKVEPHSIKGLRHVWRIDNLYDVNVYRVGNQLLRFIILPFNKTIPMFTYEKDLSVLNYSDREMAQEVEIIVQFMKENSDFIKFWYDFTFRTGMVSLGMALIAYQLESEERIHYEEYLMKNYVSNLENNSI